MFLYVACLQGKHMKILGSTRAATTCPSWCNTGTHLRVGCMLSFQALAYSPSAYCYPTVTPDGKCQSGLYALPQMKQRSLRSRSGEGTRKWSTVWCVNEHSCGIHQYSGISGCSFSTRRSGTMNPVCVFWNVAAQVLEGGYKGGALTHTHTHNKVIMENSHSWHSSLWCFFLNSFWLDGGQCISCSNY